MVQTDIRKTILVELIKYVSKSFSHVDRKYKMFYGQFDLKGCLGKKVDCRCTIILNSLFILMSLYYPFEFHELEYSKINIFKRNFFVNVDLSWTIILLTQKNLLWRPLLDSNMLKFYLEHIKTFWSVFLC